MRKLYSRIFILSIIIAATLISGYTDGFAGSRVALADTSRVKGKTAAKITDTRTNKPAYLNNGVKVNFIPFRLAKDKIFGNIASLPIPRTADNDKILNNVKVYPNPVSDQLNLSYSINRDANVTVKVMDVLGNEVATLMTERLSAGEQANSFYIASRLASGFYFIRVSAGTEIITKRISVL